MSRVVESLASAALRADHFALVRQLHIGATGDALDDGRHSLPGPWLCFAIARRSASRATRDYRRLESELGIGEQFHASPFERVEYVHIEVHQLGLREQRIGAGSEVLQSRPDGQHQVRLACQQRRAGRAGDAHGSQLQRMVPRQRTLAGLRLGNRYAMLFRKRSQRFGRVPNTTAAGHDQRSLAARNNAAALSSSAPLGGSARKLTSAARKIRRIVVRHGLNILRHRDCHRAAQRGIGQYVNRARQGAQQLLPMVNAIEIARYRLEAVIDGDASVVKILDLLQHRIGRPRYEHIPRQQQHRQAVHMRHRRRSEQIGCSRTDGSRDRHHPPPHICLGVSDRRMRHRLLVVGAKGR
jgi:hypothetical protein